MTLPHISPFTKLSAFLQGLEPLESCSALECLKLGFNKVSRLAGISSLERLQTLHLDSNPLVTLLALRPLSVLRQLQTLSLKGTPVTDKVGSAQLRARMRNTIPGTLRLLHDLLTRMSQKINSLANPGKCVFLQIEQKIQWILKDTLFSS